MKKEKNNKHMIVTAERPIDIFEYPEINKLFKERLNVESKAIDFGCGIPLDLFDLQSKYNLRKLIGIDVIPNEKEIINRYSLFIAKDAYSDCSSIKECQKKYFQHFIEDEKEAIRLINDYDEKYKIFTNYDVTKLKTDNFESVDLALLVDILHFIPFSESLKLVKIVPEMMNKNGLIIIRLHHEENRSMTKPFNSIKIGKRVYQSKFSGEKVYLFDEYGFKKIISELEKNGISRVIQPEKYLNDDQKGYKSMFYIGEKTNQF